MNIRSKKSTANNQNLWDSNTALTLLILAGLLWVAHYLNFRDFGLYEDDYAQISRPLGWNLTDLRYYLGWLLTWPQGRPLGFFLTGTLSFLGSNMGDLSTVYFIGFLIQTTNVFLFYFLIRRVSTETVALIGAIVFGLYPADTTHTFLEIGLGLRPSLTFLLMASHLYLSGYQILSYFVSVGSLLTYESAYMVFLAVPLLGMKWDKKLIREMIRHFIIWLSILFVVAGIRFGLEEERVLASGSSVENIGLILWKSIQALVIGPAVSLWMFAYGPGRTLLDWNWELTIIFLGCLPVFAWLINRSNNLSRAAMNAVEPGKISTPSINDPTHQLSIRDPQTVKLLATSLVMLCLAYTLSFTRFPPTTLYGRLTSVHMSAAVGGALLIAIICSLCLAYAQSRRFRFSALALITVFLSLLVAYRFSIQLDFKQAWMNQQEFWTRVVDLVPDLKDGTVIFVPDKNLPATRFILTNSWADPIILDQIYQFPNEWQTPPRLFVVNSNWTESILRTEDKLQWKIPRATWDAHWEILPDSNVILLEMENGTLVRRFGEIDIQGYPLHLKPLSTQTNPEWRRGNLFPYLIPSK